LSKLCFIPQVTSFCPLDSFYFFDFFAILFLFPLLFVFFRHCFHPFFGLANIRYLVVTIIFFYFPFDLLVPLFTRVLEKVHTKLVKCLLAAWVRVRSALLELMPLIIFMWFFDIFVVTRFFWMIGHDFFCWCSLFFVAFLVSIFLLIICPHFFSNLDVSRLCLLFISLCGFFQYWFLFFFLRRSLREVFLYLNIT